MEKKRTNTLFIGTEETEIKTLPDGSSIRSIVHNSRKNHIRAIGWGETGNRIIKTDQIRDTYSFPRRSIVD